MINAKFFIVIAFSILYSNILYASQSSITYYNNIKSSAIKGGVNSGDNKNNNRISISWKSTNTVTSYYYNIKSSIVKGDLNSGYNEDTNRIGITFNLNRPSTTSYRVRARIIDNFNTKYKIFNSSNFVNYRYFNEENIFSKKTNKCIEESLNSNNKTTLINKNFNLKTTLLVPIRKNNVNIPRIKPVSFMDRAFSKLIKLKPNLFFIKQANSYISYSYIKSKLKSKVHVIV